MRPFVLPIVAAFLCAAAAPAAASTRPEQSGTTNYAMRVWGSGVSAGPSGVEPGLGYASVHLDRGFGTNSRRCEAVAGKLFLSNALSGSSIDTRALPAGRGRAACFNRTGGQAIAPGPGVGVPASGGAAHAYLDRTTGRYVGTARAYATGVTRYGATDGDLLSSVLTVTSRPGAEPTVSYRLSWSTGFMTAVLVSGTEVALSDLTARFDQAVAENAEALRAFGSFGLSLVRPAMTMSSDGTRILTAPFVEMRGGLLAGHLLLGDGIRARLATTGASIRRSDLPAPGERA